MKKILTILLALVAVLPSWGAGTKIGELYYNLNTSTKTASVTYDTSSIPTSTSPAYSNFYNKRLTIPDKVVYSGVEYKVTSIGSSAFKYCSGLTSVTFPESITTIRGSAFYYCSGLTSITFPESITSIGSTAFDYCSGLKEVNIPSLEAWCNIKFESYSANPNCYAKNLLINGEELSGVVKLPSDWTVVPTAQFAGCDAVTEFIFPEGLTTIGEDAFYNCSGLSSVIFPEGLTSIGSSAFENCRGLTSVSFPEGLTEIDSYAFSDCSWLTSIIFPESITSIGEEAFGFCHQLKEVNITSLEAWCNIKFESYSANPNCYAKNLLINGEELSGVVKLPSDWTVVPTAQFAGCDAVTEFIFPEGLTTIGEYAFFNCSGLSSVIFPEGLTSIGKEAFGFCTGLTSVSFPEGLTSIGKYAFEYCSGLTSVILPEGLTEIEDFAFSFCSNLRKVISLNPTPPKNYTTSFSTPAEGNDGVLYVPEASLQTYRTTSCWKEFKNIQPIITTKGLEILVEKNPLAAGQTEQINVILTPEDATFDQFSWSSSDESVATVDATGVVSALQPGTTTITAKTNDGSGISASLELTVTDSNGRFSINDFEIGIGAELEVPVNLDLNFTDCSYSALQFDLTLPEGIALEDVTLGDELLDAGMNLTYRAQDNGDIRVIVTPADNVEGTDCIENVVTLNLKASDNASPGDEKLLISNASLATMQGADIFLDDSSCSVTLRKLLPGDANDNGSVTVADVVTIANFIAKKDVVGWCFANADVNQDKQITTADITGTVNIIAGEELSAAAFGRRQTRQAEADRVLIDDFKPVTGESLKIGVRLNNTRQYSALQSSIVIPEGMTVEGISKGTQASAHSLVHNITDDGRVEVVVFSTSNKPFSETDGSLFELEVRATADCGDIRMENILASDATATDYELSYEGGRNAGLVTSIDGIDGETEPKVYSDADGIVICNAEGLEVNIYSVTGELLSSRKVAANPERFPLEPGIYILSVGNQTYKIKK